MKFKKSILAMIMAAAMVVTSLTVWAAPAEAAGDVLVISEDAYYDAFTIEEGTAVVPAEGYSLIMIADGEVVKPEAGDYTDVYFSLQPEDYTFGSYDETDNPQGYVRRYLYNTNEEEPVFVEEAFGDVTVEEEGDYLVFDGQGSTVVVKDDGLQVLSTEGGNVKFQNINMEIYGDGICEISDIFGAGIAIVGSDSNVVVDNVNIKTVGPIMSTMNSGSGNVLLMNSTLNGYGASHDATGLHSGIESYATVQGSLTEVPWVLGLKGTLRTINVIGDTNVVYYNVKGSGNGWGVYSTDGGQSFIMINTDAYYDDSEGAEYESLYGTYVLGLPTYLLGFNSDLSAGEGNTYGIVARHGFTLGESSQENLARLDALISVETPEAEEAAEGESAEEAAPAEEEANLITLPSGEVIGAEEADINVAQGAWALFQENVGYENVEARRSTLKARYGVMSHGAKNDTFNITGTDIIAENAAFLMKQAYMTINMDETVTIDAPIIIHEQISDDAGMSSFAYDGDWSEATYPFLFEVADNGEAPASGVTANMDGMTLEGDFYNTDTDGAFLALNFDATETTGVISSAQFIHNNKSFYVVYNPDFDPAAEESEENMRFFCVDENGAAYQTTINFSFFGGCSYQPAYVDDNGIVEFFYDEAGTQYDPSEIVGYAIFYSDSEYCSDGVITPMAKANNPVYVTLTEGSVWNVTGESYIDKLVVESGSTVNGVVTVDGEVVEITDGTELEGNIVVTPAAGESAEGESAEGESAEGESAEAAAESKWDAYIAYLYEVLEIDPSFDLYEQIKGELAEAKEEDYTGMTDGTLFGAMLNSYGVVSFEEFEIGQPLPDVTSAVGLG